ncbi:MAG: 30S ribosomal protein S9 [bacterium]|nr:30S ribosomal protein S9 [bacterium]MDO5463141.1 30S ribosomal protein S9 [bacterium]
MATNEMTVTKGTGRRKTAVAHVRLVNGTGTWTVNGVALNTYIPSESLREYINQPLAMVELAGKYDVLVSAKGGGISGQAGAMRHALARALCAMDANLREVLKKAGCLTRDSRMKERKKPGQRGARARFQFSKR